MNRYAGVLLSVTSLPSQYGIGCFDKAAYAFVDWLEKAGQRYWQILPLGATAYGLPDNSPIRRSPPLRATRISSVWTPSSRRAF